MAAPDRELDVHMDATGLDFTCATCHKTASHDVAGSRYTPTAVDTGGAHLRGKADIWSENGYGFAAEEPQEVIGKVFAVESIEPYDPRRLKRSLKGAGAELMKRDFPFGAEELARRLGVHAGADVRLAFTKIGNGFWAVRLK